MRFQFCLYVYVCLVLPFQVLNQSNVDKLGMNVILLEDNPLLYFLISCNN